MRIFHFENNSENSESVDNVLYSSGIKKNLKAQNINLYKKEAFLDNFYLITCILDFVFVTNYCFLPFWNEKAWITINLFNYLLQIICNLHSAIKVYPTTLYICQVIIYCNLILKHKSNLINILIYVYQRNMSSKKAEEKETNEIWSNFCAKQSCCVCK